MSTMTPEWEDRLQFFIDYGGVQGGQLEHREWTRTALAELRRLRARRAGGEAMTVPSGRLSLVREAERRVKDGGWGDSDTVLLKEMIFILQERLAALEQRADSQQPAALPPAEARASCGEYGCGDGWHARNCPNHPAQAEAQQPAARTCSNCASMDIGSRASGSFCRTCGRDQPAAEPKLAGHAFVGCRGPASCNVGGIDRCHHRTKTGFLDCGLTRSEHPEGR